MFDKIKKIITDATPAEMREAAIAGVACLAIFIAGEMLFPTKPDSENPTR